MTGALSHPWEWWVVGRMRDQVCPQPGEQVKGIEMPLQIHCYLTVILVEHWVRLVRLVEWWSRPQGEKG